MQREAKGASSVEVPPAAEVLVAGRSAIAATTLVGARGGGVGADEIVACVDVLSRGRGARGAGMTGDLGKEASAARMPLPVQSLYAWADVTPSETLINGLAAG